MAESPKKLPPYVTYRTFTGFLGMLRQGVPDRIDRSLMRHLSGTNQGLLLQALKYLYLVDDEGMTLGALHQLVEDEGQEREQALQRILKDSYTFLFDGNGFNLATATPGQFDEKFRLTGASGETVKKCQTFFLAAARDASLPISIHIDRPAARSPDTIRPVRPRADQRGRRSRSREPLIGARPSPVVESHPPIQSRPQPSLESNSSNWAEMLLTKFPTLDPAWPDAVKEKWFDSFKALMEMGQHPSKGGNSSRVVQIGIAEEEEVDP